MVFEFLEWLGHASFVFEDNKKVVYIDPFRLRDTSRKADVIFITHPHPDHLSVEDVKKVSKPTTKIVVTQDSVDKFDKKNTIGVVPGKEYSVDGIKFSTVPAYNIVKERLDKHPKANGWVGYVIHTNGKSLYHAGDTDEIPEMADVSVDLALVPMGGTYAMGVEEVISASRKIKAKSIAPIHYRMLLGADGSSAAEKRFLKEVKHGFILDEEDPVYSF